MQAQTQQFQKFFLTLGKSFTQLGQAIGKPINAANLQLQNLSNQSHRTGSNIALGAKAGAAGLTGMAAAALSAYSALKAVQGVLESIKSASIRGAESGRRAPEIGETTQWIDAFASAAAINTGADPEAVKAEMAADSKFFADWLSGT